MLEFVWLSVLLRLYGEEEHATTGKFYTLCSAEIDCSWFMKTYRLRTVQADKLLNICRTLSNHFLLINFMPVAHVELSLNLELLFTNIAVFSC